MCNVFFTNFAKVCMASAFVLLYTNGVDATTRFATKESPNITVKANIQAVLSVTYWDGTQKEIKFFKDDGTLNSIAERTLTATVEKGVRAKIKFTTEFIAKDGSKGLPFHIDFYPISTDNNTYEKYDRTKNESSPLAFQQNQEVKFIFSLDNPDDDFEVGTYSAPVKIEFIAVS